MYKVITELEEAKRLLKIYEDEPTEKSWKRFFLTAMDAFMIYTHGTTEVMFQNKEMFNKLVLHDRHFNRWFVKNFNKKFIYDAYRDQIYCADLGYSDYQSFAKDRDIDELYNEVRKDK